MIFMINFLPINMKGNEILYGTIIVADEQVVRGKGANIKIKRKLNPNLWKYKRKNCFNFCNI
jgi:hypothetical protein